MEEIKIEEYSDEYLDICLALAERAEQEYQSAQQNILGDEIYNVAMKYWKENLNIDVQNALADKNALLAVQEDRVVGFVAYRQVNHIGLITRYAAENVTVVAPALFRAALEKMKKSGVTHVMANCGMEEIHNSDRKAFESVGFEIYLPHVMYYQLLGERPELPESSVKIAPCKPEHYADCARIAVQVWEGIHDAYIAYQGKELHDAFSANWRASKEREIIEQQSWPGAFVALMDGKVAGFCGYRIVNGNLGVLGFNGVDPQYRGNGIAKYLYEACFAHMRQQGLICTRVYTGMDNGHAPARRAYEKAGYDKRVLSMTYYLAL